MGIQGLIVDSVQWVPDGLACPVLVRGGIPAGDRRAWLNGLSGRAEAPVLLVEEARMLDGGGEMDVVIVHDQIAVFDTELIEVRDAAQRVAFPDMSAPYARAWFEKAVAAAKAAGLRTRPGCVVGIRAPELVTPAERAALGLIGADAACRWMTVEARWAAARGLKAVGIAVSAELADAAVRGLLTNLCAG